MADLFTEACVVLENSKRIHYNPETGEILATKIYGIKRKDVLKSPENKQTMLDVMRQFGYKGKMMPEFSQIKDNRKEDYKKTGWKYAEALLKAQRDNGGAFYMLLIELGDLPLYARKTANAAKKSAQTLMGELHGYYKLERMDSKENDLHVHVLTLKPDNHIFPETVNGFNVKVLKVGLDEYKYIPIHKQVRAIMCYLLKPSDARSERAKGKGRYWKEMWYEWWEESLRKNKTWESANRRGALNLDTKYLKGFTREEIEGGYDVPSDTPHISKTARLPSRVSRTIPFIISPVDSALSFVDIHPPVIPFIPQKTPQLNLRI